MEPIAVVAHKVQPQVQARDHDIFQLLRVIAHHPAHPCVLVHSGGQFPGARFVQADMTALHLRPAAADAVAAFYSLIHVPLADQQALFPRIRDWLRPGGYFLAIVGAGRWTGTAPYLGADTFWDHADAATYLRWLQESQLTPIWNHYIPEGNSRHTLVLAEASLRRANGIPPAAEAEVRARHGGCINIRSGRLPDRMQRGLLASIEFQPYADPPN